MINLYIERFEANKKQIKEYMDLCLHIVQELKDLQ